MPDSDSWIIKAIEKEAMARAMNEYNRYPKTFSFMQYSQQQIQSIILGLEAKGIIRPTLEVDEIIIRIKALP